LFRHFRASAKAFRTKRFEAGLNVSHAAEVKQRIALTGISKSIPTAHWLNREKFWCGSFPFMAVLARGRWDETRRLNSADPVS